MATFGTAAEDQAVVADEFAAVLGQDRRTAGEARAILLAFAGRRALEPQAVQQHAANDLGNAAARRLASEEDAELNAQKSPSWDRC